MTDLTNFFEIEEEEEPETEVSFHLLARCKTPERAAEEIAKARRSCNFTHTVISGQDPADPTTYNVLYRIEKKLIGRRNNNGNHDV